MGTSWNRENTLSGVQKGIDFILHFNGKAFTMRCLMNRYHITKRQAYRLVRHAEMFVNIKPDGFRIGDNGFDNYLWKFSTKS